MKRTKKEFNEALGVPDNIVKVSKQVFEDFKREFKKVLNKDEDLKYTFTYRPAKPYRIADMDIKEIKYNVELHPTDQTEKVDIISYGVSGKSKLIGKNNKPFLLSIDKEGKTNFYIRLVVPEEWSENEVIDFFDRNNVNNVKNFTHELKHEYDEFKKPLRSYPSRVDYRTFTEMMGGFEPLNELVFNMYFISEIENLVRPSEVAAEIESLGITKDEFLKFLLSNETYKTLKEINDFSLKQLKQDLKPLLGEIRELIDELDPDFDAYNRTDEEVIDEMLNMLYITLVNKRNRNFIQGMISSPAEMIFGLEPEKENWFIKYQKITEKYKNNPIGFFKALEKEMKIKSFKVIKKISKLYDYIKNDDES